VALAAALATAPTVVAAQEGSPEVEYRKAVMQAIRVNNGQLRALAELDHPEHAVHYARALYGLAEILPDVFAQGTAGPDSRALPAIWERPQEFQSSVAAFQTAAGQLLEAAERHDAAGMQRASEALGQSCGGCHQPFRAQAN
jgi:cytochrome c556